ncbi:MAG TPA: GNAT family N-acetyltransferase [Candidatus Deferrimicrobium sp.]|nr:GNAT family N-acetyltransferase [Candidatus Deferrimicrobium sp.]
MTCRVVALEESDWALLRTIRLEALADSPSAFGSTLAQEREFDEERWRGRAGGTEGAQLFLARDGDDAVGIAGVFDEGDGTAQMVSVWVSPTHRRRGVARALSVESLRFARAHGFACIRLWVTDGNAGARALYEHLGFAATGNRQPLPSDSSHDEHELELTLPDGTA